jgi:molybdopterin-guanine dinucleotide biosynthesis protein A
MISKDDTIPVLNGLVLAGGKSARMGVDKGQIAWHGKPQRYFMADLLAAFCPEVYISCREDQQSDIEKSNYRIIKDAYSGLGPYGAILSAFQERPDVAWLVVACDLPLLDAPTIQYLIQQRRVSAVATSFQSPHDSLPEPLVAIWEPKSHELLLSFLEEGRSCPRKVLMNSDVQIIQPLSPEPLMNANTPHVAQKINEIISQKNEAWKMNGAGIAAR